MLQANDIITLAAGAYRLREPLAGSAYGVVWRAASPAGAPDVALKLINRQQMSRARPALQGRWIDSAAKEISFLKSLAPWDERHIVRLLDCGEHDGLPVMALELMDSDLGRYSAARRQNGQPIPLARILGWMAQVNQALAKVHQYGWQYLDLKPANVLLDLRTGSVKLADFGTSRPRGELAAQAYEGTASWQAPEQFFPTATLSYETDTRTDYFALGALFYYLVTGGLPLRFCTECGEAYRDSQGAAPALLLARHGGIPPTLQADETALFAQALAREGFDSGAAVALLQSLLAPERDARPRHAIQVSRMLGAIGRAGGSGA